MSRSNSYSLYHHLVLVVVSLFWWSLSSFSSSSCCFATPLLPELGVVTDPRPVPLAPLAELHAIQVLSTVQLGIYSASVCRRTPVSVNLTYNKCVPFKFNNSAASRTFEALKLVDIKCDIGDGVVRIGVRGYANAQCSDVGAMFAEVTDSNIGMENETIVINPLVCYAVSYEIAPPPNILSIITYQSYSCGNDVPTPSPQPYRPSPSPTPSKSPTPAPSPTPFPTRPPNATLTIYPEQNCGGEPDVVTVILDQCTPFDWSNAAVPGLTFKALMAFNIKCDTGDGFTQITVRGYQNTQCTGEHILFADTYASGTPTVIINPLTCKGLSWDVSNYPDILRVIKFTQYSCGSFELLPPTPNPSPTPQVHMSLLPTPTPTTTPSPQLYFTTRVCEYVDANCSTEPKCYSSSDDQCIAYNGFALNGLNLIGTTQYEVTCMPERASAVKHNYYTNAECDLLNPEQDFEFTVSVDGGLVINECYRTPEVGSLRSVVYERWPCSTAPPEPTRLPPPPTPSPSPMVQPTRAPTPIPTDWPTLPAPVCIDSEWIEARGLEKVHMTDGVGQLLCLVHLDQIPCGTPDHILEMVMIDNNSNNNNNNNNNNKFSLVTYAEICQVRQCISKRGRYNGVLHSVAAQLPVQDGVRLTTLSYRGTRWSKLENHFVHAAQKLGSKYIDRVLVSLQRRNSVQHLARHSERPATDNFS